MEVVATLLLIEGGVCFFAVACLNISSADRVKGCVVMIHGFTAHPGRNKPMQEDCQTNELEERMKKVPERHNTETDPRYSRTGAAISPTLLLCL
jgi:hypothetical protein